MNVLKETVVDSVGASDMFPLIGGCRVLPSTVRRWAKVGVRGIKLEYAFVGATFCTSAEAVERFLQAINQQERGKKRLTTERAAEGCETATAGA